MEENREQERITESAKITMPNAGSPHVVKPMETQPDKKNTSSRVVRDMLIVLAVFVVFIIGIVIYFAASATKLVSRIPSSCTAKEERLRSSADELKATLSKITINGHSATTITTSPNGDCLTGSGARANARFNLSAADVNVANLQVIQSLHSSTLPPSQTYNPDNNGDNTHISFLTTALATSSGDKYSVNYYLQTPITCQEFGSPACQMGSAAIQAYDLLHKPISSVEIILTSTVN